jgi:hypothetical protein
MMSKLFLFSFVIAISSNAFGWTKILDCNQGSAVIDFFNDRLHGKLYQLVIRNRGVTDFFLSKNAVRSERLNQKGELVIPLKEVNGNSSDLVGDFDAYETNGRVLYVKRLGAGLSVEAFATTQATGGMFTPTYYIANWRFESCL